MQLDRNEEDVDDPIPSYWEWHGREVQQDIVEYVRNPRRKWTGSPMSRPFPMHIMLQAMTAHGFHHFFLLFGRHPRLAVDAFLGLPQDTETVKGHKDYVDRLKQRLATAYEAASDEPKKGAGVQKDYYDEKVRHSNLEVGDRVLVEKKGHKGKQKLADL